MDELDALTEFLLKRWKILKIRHLMKNEKKYRFEASQHRLDDR
jgi:hypothetical protein